MTESEAIKWQKQLGEVFKGFHLDIEEKMNISCEMAINALEKQIPKKRDNYSCPICSHYFEDGECFTYCPECGQRLE